jgi:hypothetical protein
MFERKDWELVVWPGAISLLVTLVRLTGELLDWSPAIFNKQAGGGGSPLGITWLVFPFGAWFGWQVAKRGDLPAHLGKAFALLVAGVACVPVVGTIVTRLGLVQDGQPSQLAAIAVAGVLGLVVAYPAWPALSRTLVCYALAARVPVVLVMLVAMLGNWGTHYDVPPPDFPAMGVFAKWLWIGVLPQFTIWIWFTLVFGGLVGTVAGAIAKRRG